MVKCKFTPSNGICVSAVDTVPKGLIPVMIFPFNFPFVRRASSTQFTWVIGKNPGGVASSMKVVMCTYPICGNFT